MILEYGCMQFAYERICIIANYELFAIWKNMYSIANYEG